MYSPTAKIIDELVTLYNTDLVEYQTRSRIVKHGRTGIPYMKRYYNIKLCSEVLTFYEYYFPDPSLDFFRVNSLIYNSTRLRKTS